MSTSSWLVDLLRQLNPTQILTAAFSAFAAVVGTLATIFIAKIKGKPEVQTALNDGFTKLISEFQEERSALLARIDAQDAKIASMQRKETQMALRIMQLEGAMQSAGIKVPMEIVG